MSLDKLERIDRANLEAALEAEVGDPLEEMDARRLAVRLAKAETTSLGLLAAAFEMGRAVGVGAMLGRRTCRICGCWELCACEGGCSWIAADLCSACAMSADELAGGFGRANPLLCEEC